MMQQEVEQLRDISIIYCELVLKTKVPMKAIVCEFFRNDLKNYSDDFDQMAKEQKKEGFVSLAKLKDYDVTLNSQTKGDNSMLSSGINFGSFNRNKLLRFYVHKEYVEEFPHSQSSTSITLCLFQGNVNVQERRLNIYNMNMEAFHQNVKDIFGLNKQMSIKYMNMKDRTFINLSDKNSFPIKIFNQSRINKVGVYPIYDAGGQ